VRLCGGEGFGVGFQSVQQCADGAAFFGPALSVVDGLDAEFVGGGELSLGYASGAADGAKVDFARPVLRGVGAGGDSAGQAVVGHGIESCPGSGSISDAN
jgi:hypothetical protein